MLYVCVCLCKCAHTHVHTHAHAIAHVRKSAEGEYRGVGSLSLPCRSQGSNSGQNIWWQTRLTAKPSHNPLFCFGHSVSL